MNSHSILKDPSPAALKPPPGRRALSGVKLVGPAIAARPLPVVFASGVRPRGGRASRRLFAPVPFDARGRALSRGPGLPGGRARSIMTNSRGRVEIGPAELWRYESPGDTRGRAPIYFGTAAGRLQPRRAGSERRVLRGWRNLRAGDWY